MIKHCPGCLRHAETDVIPASSRMVARQSVHHPSPTHLHPMRMVLRIRGDGMSAKSANWEERFWQKVEKTNTCWLWTGTVNRRTGYGLLGVGGRGCMRLAHRLSYELAYGEIPTGMDIDHRCHTRRCVNPDHLRTASRKENVENHSGPQRNSSSGFRGVYRTRNGRWRAIVQHNGRQHSAGAFSTPEEAHSAVISLRNRLFTRNDIDRQQARLNHTEDDT